MFQAGMTLIKMVHFIKIIFQIVKIILFRIGHLVKEGKKIN